MYQEKILQLRNLIEENLLPLLKGNSIILLDIPFYTNTGDVLIWEGTRQFLRRNKIKIIGEYPQETFDFRELPSHTIILLQGGGNFGDVWPGFNGFRNRIIQKYPNHKIIILPQTVFYQKEENVYPDQIILSRHNNLIICARDIVSYEFLKSNFSNKILLLPDMAFCIDTSTLKKHNNTNSKKLFLKRDDKEFNTEYEYTSVLPKSYATHDWPASIQQFFDNKLERGFYYFSFNKRKQFKNWFGIHIFRKRLLKQGIQFLSNYSEIYTTRLHGVILSILLEKPVVIFDNNYGKNKSFFDTWLKDFKNIRFIPTNL